jgi:glycosyltransferase involved in cell wall biosynthesis
MKAQCRDLADQTAKTNSALQFQFLGWVGHGEVKDKVKDAHLLAMPSLWPEPFGQSGLEAASLGIPAAAFRVGGIGEWLKECENGVFAELDNHPVESFARAMLKCVESQKAHEKLSKGALERSKQFSVENHVAPLIRVFESILNRDGFPA